MILSGIIVPLLTPFKMDGQINFDEYERLIDYTVRNGVNGIFVGGTSGEFVNLTVNERIEQLKLARQVLPAGVKLLFNVSALNPEDLDTLIAAAGKEGVDGVSVVAPYYNKFDTQSIVEYFQYISEHCAKMPLFLYNMSGLTHNPITLDVLNQILPTCPNIMGIKDSSMSFTNLLEMFSSFKPDGLEIITGNDAEIMAARVFGSEGAIVAMANCFPKLVCSIWNDYGIRDFKEIWEKQSKIIQIRRLFRSIMPIMSHKAALELQGFNMGPARFPFRCLTVEEKRSIADTLDQLNIEF